MESTEYSCTLDGKEYFIMEAMYNSFLKTISVTVRCENHSIQCFVYPENHKKSIITYISSPLFTKTVLYAFLQQKGYPLPEGEVTEAIHFQAIKHHSYTDTILFSTKMYTFRAFIKEEPYYYSVNIGGKEFMGCVELFIYKPNNRFYKIPKLSQVYSEPECWHNLGKKGNTVDLLKGSFQLCQLLFGVNAFSFEDNSNVECGKTRSLGPPRKLEKPLSLTHLSIAQKGKTWYETYFNAYLLEVSEREKYMYAIQRLDDPSAKQLEYDDFVALANIRKEHYDELKTFYEKTDTWRAFFDSIPKAKHCSLFFNWLPEFMDKHILKFNPRYHEWCICLKPLGFEKEEMCDKSMEATEMAVEMYIPPNKGGRSQRTLKKRLRRNKTYKQTTTLLSFSNQF